MPGNIVYLPASIGEPYDKITILEIKAERISDPAMRKPVLEELALLSAIDHEGCGPDDPRLKALIDELRTVNNKIWDTEDAVRRFARDRDFGEDYARVSQGSYTNNDQRARIKREISALTGSAIVEIKFHSTSRI